MKRLIFTYGTLMKGQCREHVLDNRKYICDAELDNYGLYEEVSFPCAVPVKGFKVYGEVYEIDDSLKPLLDKIEGESSLYKYKEVLVHDKDNKEYKVGFYEYLRSTKDLPLRLPDGKWSTERKDIKDNYVWYVCYGSNLDFDRFMRYINNCKDTSKPIAKKNIILPHNIYFADYSEKWKGSPSFLDIDHKGESYCVEYLVTKEQYESIKKQEGKKYQRKVDLGYDEYGIKQYSFTAKEKYDLGQPSQEYLDTISRGLKDNYNFSDSEIQNYIIKCLKTQV